MTDFRHLNVRIAKNNLAYPLVRDTFLVLRNSKCEVLSVLDLKDTFHSLRLSEHAKIFCGILLYLEVLVYLPENFYGIKYIFLHLAIIYNAILDCLETRKHCKVIMDDLLLFTPTKKAHMAKLEDLLKAFAKEWTQNITKKVPVILRQNYNTWEIQYLSKIEKGV